MSRLDWDEIQNQTYLCIRCGETFKGDECLLRNRICCPKCGHRVIKKIKPPIVKRVRAI